MVVIEKETWQQGLLLSHGASWMQANVYLINHGDQKIVIKDFSDAPCMVRCTFCRFAINREIRSMQQLQPLHITPRYLGKVGDYTYAMEYIEGENFKFKKHVNSFQFLMNLQQAVSSMHDAGVAHNDLHGKNIIISSDGKFYFIDFASAFFRSAKNGMVSKLKNKIFNLCALIDSAKISVLIQKYDASYLTPLDNKTLIIKKYISQITHLWKKLINGPFLRKRTWRKRKEALKAWVLSLGSRSL
jgi:tRNA A-37 threonylcarbamoyl transferase component Bud32